LGKRQAKPQFVPLNLFEKFEEITQEKANVETDNHEYFQIFKKRSSLRFTENQLDDSTQALIK
jgi:hypothetical protein